MDIADTLHIAATLETRTPSPPPPPPPPPAGHQGLFVYRSVGREEAGVGGVGTVRQALVYNYPVATFCMNLCGFWGYGLAFETLPAHRAVVSRSFRNLVENLNGSRSAQRTYRVLHSQLPQLPRRYRDRLQGTRGYLSRTPLRTARNWRCLSPVVIGYMYVSPYRHLILDS